MRKERMIVEVGRKRDPNQLYKFPGQVLTPINILDEIVEGRTVKEILEELEQSQADLTALENKVGYFVRNAGVKKLEEVVVVNPKKEYVVAHTDNKGVIKETGLISKDGVIMEGEHIPEGVEVGYHKIVEKKIVEDVRLKRSYYRLM